MHVPRVVVAVGYFGPDDFHHARAGFDKAAGEQAALAKCIAAVEVAGFVFLLFEIKRVAGAAAHDEVQCLVVIFVEIEFRHGLVDIGHGFVDGIAQARAAAQAMAEHLGAHLEVVDFYFVHLTHVHIAAGGIQCVRIVRLAEEPGGATFADHIAFLQGARQHHEGQHRFFLRLQASDIGAEVREILRTGRLELAGRADFVGRVTGHHLVNGCRVIEQPVGCVTYRPHHRELVVYFGEVGQ